MKKSIVFLTIALLWTLPLQASDLDVVLAAAPNGAVPMNPYGNITPEEMMAKMRQSHRDNLIAQFEVYTEPESTRLIAKFAHDLYQALIDEGFSETQAMDIVTSIGLPNRR